MKHTKKILSIVILLIAMATAQAFSGFNNSKVVLMVTFETNNYTDWKKAFEAGAPVREKAGIKVLCVCRSVTNENQLVVVEEAESAEAAHNFLKVLQTRQKSGDLSKLEIKLFDKAE